MKLSTPVAFFIFNRPDTTERVFAEIAKAKPSKLLVVADGPRPDRPGEADRCATTRAIIEKVDWDCEVIKNYSDTNLGCKRRVSTGLDWVFETVVEAIVLEDDCLPSQSFFPFCQELLERYRNDTRVMQICGSNFLKGWKRDDNSYYFSKYGPIWGWASWRRAWRHYDVDIRLWPVVREKKLYENFCQNDDEAAYRINIYDKLISGEIDTWDFQWGFAKMVNSGLSVIPSVNLISNIGFGGEGTHTVSAQGNTFADMEICDISFPLSHPEIICADREADRRFMEDFAMGATRKTSPGKKLIDFMRSRIRL